MGYVLGVDLGTTSTCAAVVRDGSVEPVPLGARSALIPTVVLLKADGSLLFGEAAERRAAHEPSRVAREFKRRVGDDVPILLAGSPFSAQNLMALMLKWVVERVTELQGGPPDRMIVTHPANWSRYRRECLSDAIRAMGLGEVGMLAEPQAAATHFASGSRMASGQRIAVYDLGGGTFDSALLVKQNGSFELVGEPQGIDSLGGMDFDDALLAYALQMIAAQPDAVPGSGADGSAGSTAIDELDDIDDAAAVELRREIVAAKEILSEDTDARLDITMNGRRRSLVIRRSEFEELIRPQLELTVACLARAVAAGDPEEPVNAVVLVGGSARIPLISELINAEVRRPIALSSQPQLAVALGAAIEADRGLGGTAFVADTLAQPATGAVAANGAEPSGPAGTPAPVTGGPGSPPPTAPPAAPSQPEIPLWRRRGVVIGAAAAAVLVLVIGLVALLPRHKNSASPPATHSSTPTSTNPTVSSSAAQVAHPTAWTTIAPNPIAFEGANAVGFHNQLWVVGGNHDRKPTALVQVYDPAAKRWLPGPPQLPRPVGEAGVVTDGKSIYVIGGATSYSPTQVSNAVYRLDDPAGPWQQIPQSLPAGRLSGAAAFDGTRIVYAGGLDSGGNDHTDVFAMVPGQNWQTVTRLPQGRDNFSAAPDGHGAIWFFGGNNPSLSTVLELKGDTVTQATKELPTPSRATTAAYFPGVGACIVAGTGEAATGQTACYSSVSGTDWTPPVPPQRAGAAAALVGRTVYVVGGFTAVDGAGTQSAQSIASS